jgi:hypothetical protein
LPRFRALIFPTLSLLTKLARVSGFPVSMEAFQPCLPTPGGRLRHRSIMRPRMRAVELAFNAAVRSKPA